MQQLEETQAQRHSQALHLTRVGSTQSSPASKEGATALLQNTLILLPEHYIFGENYQQHMERPALKGALLTLGL